MGTSPHTPKVYINKDPKKESKKIEVEIIKSSLPFLYIITLLLLVAPQRSHIHSSDVVYYKTLLF